MMLLMSFTYTISESLIVPERVESCLRTETKESRLNNLLVLHARKDATNSLVIRLCNKFIDKYQTRIYIFVCY